MAGVISKLRNFDSSALLLRWLSYVISMKTSTKYGILATTVIVTGLLSLYRDFGHLLRQKPVAPPPPCNGNGNGNNNHNNNNNNGGSRNGNVKSGQSGAGGRGRGPAINLTFLKQMKFLLSIIIPKFWCPQIGLLGLHTSSLIAKTFLSIHVAKLEGKIVKQIVKRDGLAFFNLLTQWILVAIPACFLNSSIKFLECRLALSLRSRLVRKAYRNYFNNQVYYRVGNLDTRLQNPDHGLTEDITSFSSSLARLYSHITKPLLDAAMISYSLVTRAKTVGSNLYLGPTIALSVIYFTGQILKNCSPSFGKLISAEAELKAKLRHGHSRIVMNSEEIAFYGGDQIEKLGLQEAYENEIGQSRKIYFAKLWYVFIEQFFMKYVWAGSGMVLVAIPILTARGLNNDGDSTGGEANRTEYYMTTKNLLLAGGDAVSKLMTSYKEIGELAGYASRVEKIFKVFHQVQNGRYVRGNSDDDLVEISRREHFLSPSPSSTSASASATANNSCTATNNTQTQPASASALIELQDVSILTPNNDILVENFSLIVKPGMHLLITGPNGCGKSSLFRVLAGLWPISKGSISRPPPSSLFYIPQRPYMSAGNLREQIIYPDTYKDMLRKGCCDQQLSLILEHVKLSAILTREGGWVAVKDWQDVLSGGEKQRIGLARLLYHKPTYALLDECTSAVSIDVEDSIYSLIRAKGISLFTISHRPSLFKHHTHLLKFHGDGSWTFDEMKNFTN